MNLLYFILYSLEVNVQSIVESNIILDFLRHIFFFLSFDHCKAMLFQSY